MADVLRSELKGSQSPGGTKTFELDGGGAGRRGDGATGDGRVTDGDGDGDGRIFFNILIMK